MKRVVVKIARVPRDTSQPRLGYIASCNSCGWVKSFGTRTALAYSGEVHKRTHQRVEAPA